MLFRDRTEAGRILASKLHAYADRPDVLVLGLPRGGVPVAYEVAAQLHVPLDIFLVRKLGVPGRRELALGAIASGGVTIFNGVGEALGIDEEEIDRIVKSEQVELEVRDHLLRDGRSHGDSRRRWPCNRIQHAGGRPCASQATTRPGRRRRPGRVARNLCANPCRS